MKRGRIRVAPKDERTIDGIVFDSKREAARYLELKMLERVGSITDLELQPEYELQPAFDDHNGEHHRAIKYRADFRYKLHGKEIVEDVKGHKTDVYKIKRKMLLHKYNGINFQEVL